MVSPQVQHETPPPATTVTVLAGLFLGSVSLMITGIQPALLSGLVEEKRLTEAMLGRLAWAEVAALAIAAAVGPRLLRIASARRTISAACLVLALADAAVFFSHDTGLLFVSRILAGVMEGLLLAATNITITRARHPQRLYATFLMVSAIPQVMGAYTLPATLIPRFGADSGFGILCALAVVGIFVASLLGREIQDAPLRKSGTRVWTPAVIIGMCGIVVQNAANGAGWEYQARVGENLHFSGGIVGAAIAADLIFQIVGSLTVAWIAWRLPFKMMLLTSCIIQACLLMALSFVHAPNLYIVVCAIFGMMWLGMNPYQVALLIDLDKTRQVALLLASLQILGFSIGPLICSFFVSPGNVAGAFWCAAAMVLAAFGLYLASLVVANVAAIPRAVSTSA
jgi:MFS family permease